jgi:hypothetical protein
MLTVDGVAIPRPDEYIVDYEEISKAERNANGLMIKEVITYKYKLNLFWKKLEQNEMNKLMDVKNKNFFNVSFIDMYGRRVTKTFYAGTPNSKGMDWSGGKIQYWLDTKMNFIER